MGNSVQLGCIVNRDVQCVDSRIEETPKACLVFWQFTDLFFFFSLPWYLKSLLILVGQRQHA